MGRIFTDEIIDFVRENSPGFTFSEMTEMVNKKFGTDFSVKQIRIAMKNRKIATGRDTRFKKGNIPFNKGKKGYYAKGMEKGWFEKGITPMNHRPVGSERTDKDGYIWVKIAEPNIWKQKHRFIYEKHYGKIPKNGTIVFLDMDKTNCDIENLRLVTRKELARMNKRHRFSENPEVTESALALTKLEVAIYEKKGKRKESGNEKR